jgi:ABC-type transporter Mla subunit MlaD
LHNAAQEMQKSAAAGLGAINEQITLFSKSLVQISNTLGETPKQIDQALDQTLLKLTEAIDQLVLKMTRGNEAAQKEFNNSMNGAGNIFGDRIDQSSSRLAASVARFEEILQHFSAQLAQVEKSLDRLPGAVAAQVSQLEQAGGSFTRASEGVLGAAHAMNEAARPVAQANALLKQSVEQANALLKQSVEQANALLKQSVDQVQKSVQESAGQQAVLREAIGSMLSQLQNATQAAERTFIRHAERFGEVDVAMERAITQLRDGVEEVTRALGSTLGQYDEHIHNAMRSLQGAIEELAEAVEDIPKHSSSPARRP